MFEKVRGVLSSGGKFVVHIADVHERGKHVPLTQFVVEAGLSSGFVLEDVWRMNKASFGKQEAGRSDPLYVFRKVS
jgi:hypothetical protein